MAQRTCAVQATLEIGTTPCFMDHSFNLFNGQTACEVCAELRDSMNGDCGDCTVECYGAGDYCVLLEITECSSCVEDMPTDGCGITITSLP